MDGMDATGDTHTAVVRTPHSVLDGAGSFAGGIRMKSKVSSTSETPFFCSDMVGDR